MVERLRLFLGTEVDNSPLILFRMCFGFLIAAESFGAILTGWVDKTLIKPVFTFNVIGFDWIQPLDGNGMIFYFCAMGCTGILMMLGLFYRYAAGTFSVMWTLVYMMQKTHYNNHYYLLVLLGFVMLLLPANRAYSLDVKFGFIASRKSCARICHYFFITQIVIVYLYASFHKMNPDWIAAKSIGIWFEAKKHYFLIGPLLGKEWFQLLICWGGIVYDGIIVFLLLYKPTRKFGFILSVVFNLFNSVVFQIGIFPYLMIALSVFFYPPDQIRAIFFKGKEQVKETVKALPNYLTVALSLYFLVQILLPLRHYLFEGDVNFTEEGHRLSWRMMLRLKRGSLQVNVEEKETGTIHKIKLSDYLSRGQSRKVATHPDMLWQFAQRISKEFANQGKEVRVFADAKVSVNGHPRMQLVDPEVDLASVPWEHFRHSDWIFTGYQND